LATAGIDWSSGQLNRGTYAAAVVCGLEEWFTVQNDKVRHTLEGLRPLVRLTLAFGLLLLALVQMSLSARWDKDATQ
jgi:hypothetical protein